MKKNYLTFCLIVLLLAQAGFAVAASDNKVIPRIDDEAASIVREDKVEKPFIAEVSADKGNIYPQNFWMLLFGAYLFLLIFNLSFEFGKKKKLQWFWEAVFTFLAIYVWDNLDVSRSNSWFPGVVLESGIIIYAFYFYLHTKMLEKQASQDSK